MALSQARRLLVQLSEANTAVLDDPQLVNSDCYKSWVLRIKPTKLDEEISSKDVIPMGDLEKLKKYVISDLEKYEEPPIKVDLSKS